MFYIVFSGGKYVVVRNLCVFVFVYFPTILRRFSSIAIAGIKLPGWTPLWASKYDNVLFLRQLFNMFQ